MNTGKNSTRPTLHVKEQMSNENDNNYVEDPSSPSSAGVTIHGTVYYPIPSQYDYQATQQGESYMDPIYAEHQGAATQYPNTNADHFPMDGNNQYYPNADCYSQGYAAHETQQYYPNADCYSQGYAGYGYDQYYPTADCYSQGYAAYETQQYYPDADYASQNEEKFNESDNNYVGNEDPSAGVTIHGMVYYPIPAQYNYQATRQEESYVDPIYAEHQEAAENMKMINEETKQEISGERKILFGSFHEYPWCFRTVSSPTDVRNFDFNNEKEIAPCAGNKIGIMFPGFEFVAKK